MSTAYADLVASTQALLISQPSTVVAISGFGGAGKSTLAKQLVDDFDDSVTVSSDDFSLSQQSGRCDDWASIDRERMATQLLQPARSNTSIRYQQYDWPNDCLGDWRELGTPRLLILEGIGIIHPTLVDLFDFSVWIDCPLEVASEQGRRRDKEIYEVDHDALWRDLWTPNDRDYFARFHPDQLVDLVYAASVSTDPVDR